MGDTLQSYIRYRKLNQCTALENFLDYRNKVYQREKLAQYAPATIKVPIKAPVTPVITSGKKSDKKNSSVPLITTSPASPEDVCLSSVLVRER